MTRDFKLNGNRLGMSIRGQDGFGNFSRLGLLQLGNPGLDLVHWQHFADYPSRSHADQILADAQLFSHQRLFLQGIQLTLGTRAGIGNCTIDDDSLQLMIVIDRFFGQGSWRRTELVGRINPRGTGWHFRKQPAQIWFFSLESGMQSITVKSLRPGKGSFDN